MGEGDCRHSSRPDQPKVRDHTTGVSQGQDTQPGAWPAAPATISEERREQTWYPLTSCLHGAKRGCSVTVTVDDLVSPVLLAVLRQWDRQA